MGLFSSSMCKSPNAPDFLSLFSLAVLVIKSYKAIFVDIIVIRFLGAGAIVYFVLHLIVMLCCLFAYSCACCLVINSSNRYCYGFKEMGGVCKELIFVVIGLVALVIVETAVVGVGLIFIG